MDDFVALIESKGLLSGSHNVSRMTVKEAYVWSQRRTTSTHAKVEHEEKSLHLGQRRENTGHSHVQMQTK